MNIQDIAKSIDAEIFVPSGCSLQGEISGVADIREAEEDKLTFFIGYKYKKYLNTTKAKAVIIDEKREDISIVQLVHKNVQLAMAEATRLFFRPRYSFHGVSEHAHIHPKACVSKDVTIYPHCFIDEGAEISSNCILYPHTYIGRNVKVGKNTILNPHVVLMEGVEVGARVVIHSGAVIGSDGFGFVPLGTKNIKIPQNGSVKIGDDVEIGALTTVDCGTLNDTYIRSGSKLDSHVHVGHNVDLGENSMLCGQVGIAGSAKIGKNFIAGGQAAVGPGVEVPSSTMLGAKAGITKDICQPGEYHGMPAMRANDWRRQTVALKKLSSMVKEINKLKLEIEGLKR